MPTRWRRTPSGTAERPSGHGFRRRHGRARQLPGPRRRRNTGRTAARAAWTPGAVRPGAGRASAGTGGGPVARRSSVHVPSPQGRPGGPTRTNRAYLRRRGRGSKAISRPSAAVIIRVAATGAVAVISVAVISVAVISESIQLL